MNRIVIAIVFAVGCADHTSTSNAPALTGDPCAVATTADTCQSDAGCMWFGTGCACPPNDPSCVCSPGACMSRDGSAGGGSGSASAGTACACPNGGVCYEQIGGPAQQGGSGPQIECTLPAPGAGDPCTRISGEGTCTDSTTVTGLCICDNGAR